MGSALADRSPCVSRLPLRVLSCDRMMITTISTAARRRAAVPAAVAASLLLASCGGGGSGGGASVSVSTGTDYTAAQVATKCNTLFGSPAHVAKKLHVGAFALSTHPSHGDDYIHCDYLVTGEHTSPVYSVSVIHATPKTLLASGIGGLTGLNGQTIKGSGYSDVLVSGSKTSQGTTYLLASLPLKHISSSLRSSIRSWLRSLVGNVST